MRRPKESNAYSSLLDGLKPSIDVSSGQSLKFYPLVVFFVVLKLQPTDLLHDDTAEGVCDENDGSARLLFNNH